jgi:hypothetical protein
MLYDHRVPGCASSGILARTVDHRLQRRPRVEDVRVDDHLVDRVGRAET